MSDVVAQKHLNRDLVAIVSILLATFAVFRISPVHNVCDSQFQLLVSQQLLRTHRIGITPEVLPPSDLKRYELGSKYWFPLYQLLPAGGRLYHYYPPGNTILPLPYVALANATGLSVIDRNGIYDVQAEILMQRGLAAVLMAILSVIIFATCRLMLPLSWSLAITAATAFGSPIWSTASRALWNHTWGIVFLGLAIWLIVRSELKQARLKPVLLGTYLSWLYLIRPTFVLSIVAITIYVAIYHRRILPPLVMTGFIWLAVSLAYSQYHFGRPLPDYYSTKGLEFESFWKNFAGTLINPSRGLLIYEPILFVVAYLLLRYRKNVRAPLAILAGAVMVGHLLLISSFSFWHGAGCYGPRYCTDLVPWLALLGALAVEARLNWRRNHAAPGSMPQIASQWSLAVFVLMWSVALNGIGATCKTAAFDWNMDTFGPGGEISRLWDWKHPQFLGFERARIQPPGPPN